MTDQPNAADMAAFGASDYACYRWPGEEDHALRAAFCEGAAHAVSRHAPRAQHGCVFCAMGLTPDDDGNHYDRVMKKDVQCVEKRDKLRDALQQVHDFMLEDVKSGDSGLWTEAYSEIFDVVVDGLSTEPTPRAPDIESLCRDYAQRWLGQDWPAMDGNEKAYWRIEAYRWIKCWSAAEPAPGALNSCPCGAGEEPCPGPDGKPLCVSTERRCQKCGEPTQCEEAWVDGQIWCHPCADAVPGGFALSGKPIAWRRTWADGVCSFVSTSDKPQEVSGTTLTPLYTSSSTERGGNTLTAEEKSDRAAAFAQARAFTQADGKQP